MIAGLPEITVITVGGVILISTICLLIWAFMFEEVMDD